MNPLFGLLLSVLAALENSKPDSERYFQSALANFERLNYERALLQASKSEARASTAQDEAKAAILRGIILAESRRTAAARTAFETGFLLDPETRLPTEVSPKIVALSEAARAKARKALTDADTTQADRRQEQTVSTAKSCANSPVLSSDVWSRAKADAIVAHLTKSNIPDVSATAQSTVQRLDAWADEWADLQLAVCLRERVFHTMTPAVANARRRCLENQIGAFSTLASTLVTVDSFGVQASNITRYLPPPDDCLVQGPLSKPPNEDNKEVNQLQQQALALLETGQSEPLAELMPRLLKLSQSSKDLKVQADALFWDALAKFEAGKMVEAKATLQEVIPRFLEAQSPRKALRALYLMVFIQGVHQDDFSGASASHAWAERILSREEDAPLLRARLGIRWGAALSAMGKTKSSQAVLQDAVQVLERADSSASIDNDLGLALNNLGNLLLKIDRDEEAIVVFEKASRVITNRFGENQPLLVKIWGLLAQEYLEVGNLPKAKKYAELSAGLSERLKWPKGKSIVFSVLADIHLIESHPDLAVALLQEVADWKEKSLSPQHPNFMSTWLPFGYALRRVGSYERALAYHERALLLATTLSLPEEKAVAETEVALDHIALGQWVRVPELAAACSKSDKKKLLHADESLSCKLVNAELANHQGNRKLGSKLLGAIVESRNPGCKGIRTWLCDEMKEVARTKLAASQN